MKVRPVVLITQVIAAGVVGLTSSGLLLYFYFRRYGNDEPLGLAAALWFAAIVVPSLLAVAYFFWALDSFLIRDETKRGVCRSCGYDLGATPERCPECGETVIE